MSVIKIPGINVQMWSTEDGWRYDGPASCGPKEVREGGRGPYWRGPIDVKHKDTLVKRAKKLGYEIINQD